MGNSGKPPSGALDRTETARTQMHCRTTIPPWYATLTTASRQLIQRPAAAVSQPRLSPADSRGEGEDSTVGSRSWPTLHGTGFSLRPGAACGLPLDVLEPKLTRLLQCVSVSLHCVELLAVYYLMQCVMIPFPSRFLLVFYKCSAWVLGGVSPLIALTGLIYSPRQAPTQATPQIRKCISS